MRHSKSKSKLSLNSNSKSSNLKPNADIESSLSNRIRLEEKENENFNKNKQALIIKRNIDFGATDEKTNDISYLEEKYHSKKKENLQKQQNKILNEYYNNDNKSEFENNKKNNNNIYKACDSRTLMQNTNEEGVNFSNTYNTNSINTERFDKSYTSYIINSNKKPTNNQQNSINLTNETNFYIKPKAKNLQQKADSFAERPIKDNNKNNLNNKDDENLHVKYFKSNQDRDDQNDLKRISENNNNNINYNGDAMFVTSADIKGENNKADFSSRRNSKTSNKNSIQKQNSIKSNINLKNSTSSIKEKNNNNSINSKPFTHNSNSFKLQKDEILALNKILEAELSKKNQIIQFSGLGSQYNKINKFDLKFNKDLAKISRAYGKNESRNKFANKEQYDELMQEVKDFETYRNIKIVNEKHNHKSRLLPLISKKKNSFEALAGNFFLNVKTQKESPDYFNIDEEFENYLKNKSDKDKYMSLFDEEKATPQV